MKFEVSDPSLLPRREESHIVTIEFDRTQLTRALMFFLRAQTTLDIPHTDPTSTVIDSKSVRMRWDLK